MIDNISQRLKSILTWIGESDKIADIGCDHGYLGILSLSKNVRYIQNIDNKEGPLSSAKQNFKDLDHNAKVFFTLSSGMDDLNEEVDTVCICGMGADNIIEIISKHLQRAKMLKKIILVPHTKPYSIRKFLSSNNFRIVDEMIVFENNKYYEAFCVVPTNELVELSDDECLLGPVLLKNQSKVFIDKWTIRYNQLNDIIKCLNENSESYEKIKREMLIIKNNVGDINDKGLSRKS